MDKETFEKENS